MADYSSTEYERLMLRLRPDVYQQLKADADLMGIMPLHYASVALGLGLRVLRRTVHPEVSLPESAWAQIGESMAHAMNPHITSNFAELMKNPEAIQGMATMLAAMESTNSS